MSEPSPKAKQAAKEAGYSPEGQGWTTFLHGYETATAKAREELENERFTRAHWEDRAEKAEKQLAHQQPSAPTADGYPVSTQQEGGGWANPDQLSSMKGAPTADVEKFKQEAERTYGENTFAAQVYEAGCHYGATQARAPLVADKERLDWLDSEQAMCDAGGKEYYQSWEVTASQDFHGGVREAIDNARAAALTGTGEKK